MRTSTAQIPDLLLPDAAHTSTPPAPGATPPLRPCARGFTLVEIIVVVSIFALFVIMVQMNLLGTLRRSRAKASLQEFVSAMQMAASAAAESDRRYEVLVDVGEQTYLLREMTSSELAVVRDEEIITQGRFAPDFPVRYVEHDDGEYTNQGRAWFQVGHAGWRYGGKVVFLDEEEQRYTVVISRITPIVELVAGDPPLMKPKAKDEVPFL